MDNFFNTNLKLDNADIFIRRKSILNAITNNLDLLDGKLLDIGCGKMPYREFILNNSQVTSYIGLDIETALSYDNLVKPDFYWNGKLMPFENTSFKCAIATEVLEHCPDPELIMSETHRILEDNGLFFFTVPFVWNLHETPHDEYRFTPFSFARHLSNVGFKDINLFTSGGWDLFLAQALGTWLVRSGISYRKKKLLAPFIIKCMKILIEKDKKRVISFREGQMITDIYGYARK